MIADEVRNHKVSRFTEKLKHSALAVDPSGTLVITGGINLSSGKVEGAGAMVDCVNDRVTEMSEMLEPKYNHILVFCNGKVFALGGYANG